jgi:hypothetical protein
VVTFLNVDGSVTNCEQGLVIYQLGSGANAQFFISNQAGGYYVCSAQSFDEPVGPADAGTYPGATQASPVDPNDAQGPVGVGPDNTVAPGSVLPYRIDFENASDATGPAQLVSVADQLDPNLDPSTFQFTQVTFGNYTFNVPAGQQAFRTVVQMSDHGRAFEVMVGGHLDLQTGLVTVSFQSLDPTTHLPPDGLTGFLLPEDGSGRGMGSVSYTIQARADLPAGTLIRNVAEVSFNAAPPTATDQVNDTNRAAGIDPNKQDLVTIGALPGQPSAPTTDAATGPVVSVNAVAPIVTDTATVRKAGPDVDSGKRDLATPAGVPLPAATADTGEASDLPPAFSIHSGTVCSGLAGARGPDLTPLTQTLPTDAVSRIDQALARPLDSFDVTGFTDFAVGTLGEEEFAVGSPSSPLMTMPGTTPARQTESPAALRESASTDSTAEAKADAADGASGSEGDASSEV